MSRANIFPRPVPAASRIHNVNSDMKLIVILRDPIKRLVSEYLHNKDIGQDPIEAKMSLEDLVFKPNSLEINSSYVPVRKGMYAMFLPKWLEVFNRDQLLIIDGDSFAKDPLPWLKTAEIFLNIKPHFKDTHFVYNKARGFYCHKRGCMQKTKGRTHPTLAADKLKSLEEFYKPFNKKFKQMSGLQFDWLNSYQKT